MRPFLAPPERLTRIRLFRSVSWFLFFHTPKDSSIKTYFTSLRVPFTLLRGFILFAAGAGTVSCNAQTATLDGTTLTELALQSPGTPRQQAWLEASIDQRVRLAEKLGDEGARTFSQSKGWTPVFDGSVRGLAQGPDQIYIGPDDVVHVIEAKGGGGQLGHAYGHPQASSEWAVEAAKKVLRSPSATEAERKGAELVLKAAARGDLQVHVIRTSHVLGEPTAAVLEQTVHCTDDAARLAKSALDDLAKAVSTSVDDVARATDDAARVAESVAQSADDVSRAAAEAGVLAKTISKIALPAAVVLDTGLRVYEGSHTEAQYAQGAITTQQREVAHARNVVGMAGGWAGAWAGAGVGAMGGATAGTMVAPGPGSAIGGFVGGVAGGVAGYLGGDAAAAAAAESAVNAVHSAGNTVADSTKSAARGISRAWNWAWGN